VASGFGRNLARRVATAAVALPLLGLALFRGPALLLVGIAAAATLVALFEFDRLLEARGLRSLRLAGLLATLAIFAAVALPGPSVVSLWPAAALLFLTAALARAADPQHAVPAVAGTLLGTLYLGALGGTIAGLRLLRPQEDGPWRVTLLLAIIMGSDTFAFFVGHALGRRKLAPRISPGKTIEGALGGLIGGVSGALLVRWLGLPALPLAHAPLLGALVAAFGICGDLVESLLKRWAGVKDSGALLPGHGGMLDRLDSLLFGAPVLYYYFLYVQ
jgi:phosphatidate cytidylyltransferase